MGVYVKGMEMPNSCYLCCFYNGLGCNATKKIFPMFTNVAIRREDCPLVEVSPHGRLIEKNSVFELIQCVPSVDKLLPVEFMKALYKIQTVIEAEEEICTKN